MDVNYLIRSNFPNVNSEKIQKLQIFSEALRDYNQRVNLISRRDVENIPVAHILHSLSIAKFIQFAPGSKVLDLGTGGGLPGLPLAIMFPETTFHLIDRIGKKIDAARKFTQLLELDNVSVQHGDSGECHEKFDFVVSRAVMPQAQLIKAIRKNISNSSHNKISNGLITLKGGDLTAELAECQQNSQVVPLTDYFDIPFFQTKKLVYTQL